MVRLIAPSFSGLSKFALPGSGRGTQGRRRISATALPDGLYRQGSHPGIRGTKSTIAIAEAELNRTGPITDSPQGSQTPRTKNFHFLGVRFFFSAVVLAFLSCWRIRFQSVLGCVGLSVMVKCFPPSRSEAIARLGQMVLMQGNRRQFAERVVRSFQQAGTRPCSACVSWIRQVPWQTAARRAG